MQTKSIKLKMIIAAALFILMFCPQSAAASDNIEQLKIATSDNRPFYFDRLLHTAFKDIGYDMSVEAFVLQSGYELANSGEIDGVISATPGMTDLYPNLKQVPFIIDEAEIYVFTKSESELSINSWDDFSKLSVGVLINRIYILSQMPQDVQIISKETSISLMDGLINGEYDVAILALRSHETFNLPDNIKKVSKIESLPEYLYMHKKFEYLIPEIKESLARIYSDGRSSDILSDNYTINDNSTKTVLHIISSNSEVARQDAFIKELRNSFSGDESIEWYTLALDSKRFTLDSSRMTHFARLLRTDCVNRNIAAVIVSGDDGFEFVKEYYNLMFRNTPVLFYGVSEVNSVDVEDYSQNFTGIYEFLQAKETASLATMLFPGITNMYIINDDTTEGRNYKAKMEEQLKPLADEKGIIIEYNENVDFYSIIERIQELPQSSIVFLGSYFQDSNGQYYSQSELKRIFDNNCDLPVITMFSTDLSAGALGGRCADYQSYGSAIAQTLRRILDGESVSNIPVIKSSDYNQWVFNKVYLDKFKINENLLPNDSEILNKKPSVWESDPLFVIAIIAFAVTGIMITAGLSLFLYIRNKHKQALKTQKELSGKDIKIKEVSDRLERIIETAPISFVISINDIIVDLNEDMRKNFGVGIGDEIVRIYENHAQRNLFLERVMRGDTLKNEIVKFKFTDGKIHRCFLNITSTDYNREKAVAAWIIDIETDQEKTDQLRTARKSLQTILDTMPMSVCIIDAESFDMVYGNNACLDMLGYEKANELYGLKFSDIMAETQKNGDLCGDTCSMLVNKEIPNVSEIQIRLANGGMVDVRIHTTSINYNGKKSMIGIMTDLTAEKEYERMLFETAKKEKEANQLKSRFLVNMSHEIRTPMNAIIGLSEIELRKEIDKDTKYVYTKIHTSAKNLLNIINDILDLSKIEAEKMELHEEEFNLEEVVESALLVAAPRLDGKNVELLLNAALDLPRFLIGDKTRLWQILKNFLDNSAKFTEKGKIVLTIKVDNEASNEKVVFISFIIEDTGIGLSDEQIQQIFKPYMQVYSEAQKRYTGTGLGMALSKEFVTLMGGVMSLGSSLGKGTLITLNIPFKRSENKETELDVTKFPELDGIKILAVDDDELSLLIMKEILTTAGASLELARSGEEAMEIILTHRDHGMVFDVILLDYMMGGINGLETAKQIQTSLSKAPKLLMVTAYQRLLLKKELEANNIDDVIEKPFVPSQFIKTIRKIFTQNGDFAEDDLDELQCFKDVTVLLCEDYVINHEVASGMFSEFGIETVIAENGKIGVDILKSGKMDFDLIFMDLQMPVMDGYEATRIIRADKRFDKIPIISLTADAMKEVANKCREAGMNDHLAKPIEFDSLEEIFMKWLPSEKRIQKGINASFDDKSVQINEAIIRDKTQEDKIKEDKDVKDNNAKNSAIARFGGKVALYEKALRGFAKDLPEEWQSFEDIVSDIEEAKRNIHKIKGVAGNLSETDIYRYAAEFESSLRLGKPDQQLYLRLKSVCAEFKKRAAAATEEAGSTLLGEIEEFIRNINILSDALRDYDLKKCSSALDILKMKEWPDIDPKKLENIYSLVENYDYDAALEALEEMTK